MTVRCLPVVHIYIYIYVCISICIHLSYSFDIFSYLHTHLSFHVFLIYPNIHHFCIQVFFVSILPTWMGFPHVFYSLSRSSGSKGALELPPGVFLVILGSSSAGKNSGESEQWLTSWARFWVAVILLGDNIHPRNLTAGTWKWLFPIGISFSGADFQVPC